jgi:proteasome lid subunit RPN8/RPN11
VAFQLGNKPLSGDEMIFGEMRLRQPQRRQRPDRDQHFACLACDVPAIDDLPIFLDRKAADAIERHALSDTSVELGGILLGKECLDPSSGQPYVWVTASLEAKHYANTQASFTYTHDSWEEISRERDRLFPECDIVGWYHTHPSFGIFLSHHDLFIHQHFFAQPLQVAYVVDPINMSRGFFQWRADGLAPVGGFYLTADRADRLALARLANELERLPNSEGSTGGGLSPRLEAELIKMLTRPATREATSSLEWARLATVFGLWGALFGVLVAAVALWLYQLHGRLVAQTEALRGLTRSIDEVSSAQRLALDTLLEKSGGDPAAKLAERYAMAIKTRDDALHAIAVQRTVNDALGEKTKDLEDRATILAKDLAEARKKLTELEPQAYDAPKLRERVESLEDSNGRLQRRLDELAPWIDSADGKRALALQRDLGYFRVATYTGWGFVGLFLLGLGGAYIYYKPLLEQTPPEAEHPPHRIE